MRIANRTALCVIVFAISLYSRPAAAQSQSNDADAGRASVPLRLTLSAGTVIPVRSTEWLSSDSNRPGDTFSAVLDQPLIVDGWVVARHGQTVIGRVAVAEKARRGNG